MSRQISYNLTPVKELLIPSLEKLGVMLLVKREDLNHPFVSGNKWWKLKYNLQEAHQLKKDALLTFGGAYSNHIYATAAAARELGLKSIGIIRGEETKPLNHTLAFAESCDMNLHYIPREAYRKKTEPDFMEQLRNQFGDFYLIPEGGTNELAVKGVAEFASTLIKEVDFDYLCLPVGTGGTMAGLVRGFSGRKKVLGFSALKGGGFLNDEVKTLSGNPFDNWKIIEDYHFDGYAKSTSELINFIKEMDGQYYLPLDRVYTSKMMFGVFDLIRKGFFEKGSTVLMLHTGGLQGRKP